MARGGWLCVVVMMWLATVSATSSQTTSELGCDTCEIIVGLANATLSSNTTMNELAAWLDSECATLGWLSGPCVTLANTLTGAIELLPKGIKLLGYDSPNDVCSFLSYCTVPCCATTSGPEQIHLALGPLPNTMVVSWATLTQTQQSVVQYGTSATNLQFSVVGEISTYNQGGWLGFIHHVHLDNLIDGQQYFYRVGSSDAEGWSAVYNFVNQVPQRFAVVGDMGAGPNSDQNIAIMSKLVQTRHIDAVLHVGDISYANGIQRLWDRFMNKIQPIAAYVPYMVLPGNHEIPWNFTSFKSRFFMPGGGSTQAPEDANMFWSLDLGGSYLHLIGSNTESPIDTAMFDDVQIKWLVDDLARARAAGKKWIVWMGHRPLYCSMKSSDCEGDAAYLRGLLESTLNAYRVDLALMGHVHNYERIYPTVNGTAVDRSADNIFVNPSAPVYIVNGAGGNRENPDPANPSPPAWSAFQLGDWGYGILQLDLVGHQLDWQFYQASTGLLVDKMAIQKS